MEVYQFLGRVWSDHGIFSHDQVCLFPAVIFWLLYISCLVSIVQGFGHSTCYKLLYKYALVSVN